MRNKKIWAIALAMILAVSSFTGCSGSGDNNKETETTKKEEAAKPIPSTNPYGLRDSVADGAILHCFSWSFDTIIESMEDIAMAGYSAIQTSPINACYDGGNAGRDLFGQGKWFYHYQPTDWTIGNYQLGTRDEFIKLCDTAHSYGIKVIVDVAPNHTTTTTEALGEGLLNAVGGIDKLYHDNGKETIDNYSDRSQCTLMAVGGLYDVDTENPAFQDYFISYMNDVIACGADGFRFDTAKHIGLSDDPQEDPNQPNNFWDRITTEITNADSLFLYGECLQDGGERIADYIDKIGATTASGYGSMIRGIFNTGYLSPTTILDLRIGDAKPNVVTWVESHDNYTGDDKTFSTLTNEQIVLAWSAITAREAGTPLFFARPYGSSAKAKWGTFNKIGMVGDNLYKDPTVVAANRFRNAMTGLPESVFNPDEENTSVVAIQRGNKGIVLINGSENTFLGTINTTLEDGTYVNRVDGKTEYTVESGSMYAKVPAKSAVILYNEGYVSLEPAAVVKVADGTQGSFLTDTIDVTLVAKNCTKASYSINGGDAVSFNDGDVITIGDTMKPSDLLELKLTGENAAGKTTCITYLFEKQDTVKQGTKIYFEKPEAWADDVYCYVYDESSHSYTKQNSAWPGVLMQKEADGTYSYTFDDEWIAPLVIFNDRTNQSNGALEPGAPVIADKLYTVE